MFVCVCHGVPQSEVEASIAGGATTREDVTRACRAGGDCGACHGMIEDMIEAACDAACSHSQSGPQLIDASRLAAPRSSQDDSSERERAA